MVWYLSWPAVSLWRQEEYINMNNVFQKGVNTPILLVSDGAFWRCLRHANWTCLPVECFWSIPIFFQPFITLVPTCLKHDADINFRISIMWKKKGITLVVFVLSLYFIFCIYQKGKANCHILLCLCFTHCPNFWFTWVVTNLKRLHIKRANFLC